ncbi:MAG: YebC/PmpR family DNA-binding transcriptional regulator [Bdellovibrionales bacterium]|nr:YebC/PmpR family DNA-binding transcriptional regulator [Bdellovibrionales bacterium]
MGKSWKNPAKAAIAAKKGALFTKLAREISVAARLGGPDPQYNARLSLAVAQAKTQSCPKDTIERAIRKGSGQDSDAAQFEETLYEGYGPHNVGIMVECQTDNKNRTVTEIRNLFRKYGGHMGETGSVAWMFDRVSLVEGTKENIGDPEEEAIEAGANEVDGNPEEGYSFYGSPEELDAIRTALQSRNWGITTSELSYKAKNYTSLSEEQLTEVSTLLEALEDNEDSHRVHATIK